MGEVRKQKDPAVEKRKETLRKRAKELISNYQLSWNICLEGELTSFFRQLKKSIRLMMKTGRRMQMMKMCFLLTGRKEIRTFLRTLRALACPTRFTCI